MGMSDLYMVCSEYINTYECFVDGLVVAGVLGSDVLG